MSDDVTKPVNDAERFEDLMRRGLVSWREYNELHALYTDARGQVIATGWTRGTPEPDRTRQFVAIGKEYARRRDLMLKFATERREGGYYQTSGQWVLCSPIRFVKHEREAMRKAIGVDE